MILLLVLFLYTCRDQPIHLVDAYNASVRATYRPINSFGEMESPKAVTFTPDGRRVFAAGFRTDRVIHVFDTENPGNYSDILRLGTTKRSSDGQKGLISALSFPAKTATSTFAGGHIMAVGTYSPGSIYIYDDRRPNGDPAATILCDGLCIVGHGKSNSRKKRFIYNRFRYSYQTEQSYTNKYKPLDIFSNAKNKWYHNQTRRGVTQLTWSKGYNEFFLFSASRRSDSVLAWDMRVLSGNVSVPIQGTTAYSRDGTTNQKLEFDIDEQSKNIFVASRDGTVKIYDVLEGKLINVIDGFKQTVNGVSFTKFGSDCSKDMLAVVCGDHTFDELCLHDDDTFTSHDIMIKYHKDRILRGSLELHML